MALRGAEAEGTCLVSEAMRRSGSSVFSIPLPQDQVAEFILEPVLCTLATGSGSTILPSHVCSELRLVTLPQEVALSLLPFLSTESS